MILYINAVVNIYLIDQLSLIIIFYILNLLLTKWSPKKDFLINTFIPLDISLVPHPSFVASTAEAEIAFVFFWSIKKYWHSSSHPYDYLLYTSTQETFTILVDKKLVDAFALLPHFVLNRGWSLSQYSVSFQAILFERRELSNNMIFTSSFNCCIVVLIFLPLISAFNYDYTIRAKPTGKECYYQPILEQNVQVEFEYQVSYPLSSSQPGCYANIHWDKIW